MLIEAASLLVVSPHPDDAALSLGGTLLARNGRASHVWNVFDLQHYTRPGLDAPGARARLDAEDRAACAALGVTRWQAGLPEAGLRGYSRLGERLRPESTFPLEPALFDQVATAFEHVVRGIQPDVVALPAGVGGHVDHVLAREAARAVVGPLPVVLYEDLPYGLNDTWRGLALASLAEAGWSATEVLVPIASMLGKKEAILALYHSQLAPRDVRGVIRHGARLGAERVWITGPECRCAGSRSTEPR